MQRPHYQWRRFLWRAPLIDGARQSAWTAVRQHRPRSPSNKAIQALTLTKRPPANAEGVNLVQSVPLPHQDVQPRKGNCSQDYPFVVVLGRAEHDAAFGLTTRILIAMQQAYGASFGEWTRPVTYKEIAAHFHRPPKSVGNAMRALVAGNYLDRHQVSNTTGGQLYQYKLAAPRPGWVGLASVGENS